MQTPDRALLLDIALHEQRKTDCINSKRGNDCSGRGGREAKNEGGGLSSTQMELC